MGYSNTGIFSQIPSISKVDSADTRSTDKDVNFSTEFGANLIYYPSYFILFGNVTSPCVYLCNFIVMDS
jgi:hypothetical protein